MTDDIENKVQQMRDAVLGRELLAWCHMRREETPRRFTVLIQEAARRLTKSPTDLRFGHEPAPETRQPTRQPG